jgi:hypothetical protein
VVGAAGGDVDRHVADQPHAAVGRVAAQRGPLAVEADLVGDRVAAAVLPPVVDPERVALAEVELLRAGDRRPRLGQQPRPGGERRLGLVGRAIAVGRAERQHLPPGLAGVREPVDERVRVAPEPAAGQGGRVQLDAARTKEFH